MLGVSSLPDNLEVSNMREKTPEIINHGQGGQDRIGKYLTVQGSGAQDNTSMRRQLQASFSNLEDSEAEFKVN